MVSDFMKGRYNLMKIFVGIDIAKLNHFAAAISSDGEILIGVPGLLPLSQKQPFFCLGLQFPGNG